MITISGDIHIKINDKYEDFQIKRYFKLFEMLTRNKTLILAGDIFDKQPTFLEVGLFIYLVNLAREKGVQIFIVEGNHDYTRKTKYLEKLCWVSKFDNLYYPKNNEKIKIDNFDVTFAHNSFIRYGGVIDNNSGILVSHIACDLPQYNKKGEYNFDNLISYEYVILGDIHNYKHYQENVYYTTSPYRTHIKTINSPEEIDNSFFSYINFDGVINYIETNLPNIYKSLVEFENNTDNIVEFEKLNEVEKVVEKTYQITQHIEFKQDNFLESIIQSIVSLTGENPEVYLNDLRELKVIT